MADLTTSPRQAGLFPGGPGRARPLAFEHPVFVTRPLLPALSDYTSRLEAVWASQQLTNAGLEHRSLEAELRTSLGAPWLSLLANGSLALLIGAQALGWGGEVITTPFTFPATPHALTRNGITPVFADIDPDTMCLDPASVSKLVGPRTRGILGVHVYGMPCDVSGLEAVAREHGLTIMYDAAHAFGTEIAGAPIASFGDATMFSFHATKLFHTAEGGALAVADPARKQTVDLLRNFGIASPDSVLMPGINAKMSELHAAMGRLVLELVPEERSRRRAVRESYRGGLAGIPGVRLVELPASVTHSEQYLIARVNAAEAGVSRDELHDRLLEFNIVSRKYFSPLCTEYECYRDLVAGGSSATRNAAKVATEVLALPFFSGLDEISIDNICSAIRYVVATA